MLVRTTPTTLSVELCAQNTPNQPVDAIEKFNRLYRKCPVESKRPGNAPIRREAFSVKRLYEPQPHRFLFAAPPRAGALNSREALFRQVRFRGSRRLEQTICRHWPTYGE